MIENVERLKQRCDETVEEKRLLDERSELTKQRMARAEVLISSLSGEQVRWKSDADRLAEELVRGCARTREAMGREERGVRVFMWQRVRMHRGVNRLRRSTDRSTDTCTIPTLH